VGLSKVYDSSELYGQRPSYTDRRCLPNLVRRHERAHARANREIDVVKILTSVTAQVIGQGRDEVIPSGTCGTVVLVHPGAYEVEFELSAPEGWALATVPAGAVELHWKAPKRGS